MSDETLSFRIIIPVDLPVLYRKNRIENAKGELARQLVDYLLKNKETRMSVTLQEKSEINYYNEIYTLSCYIFAVQEYPATIYMQKFEDMNWRALSSSAIEEIKIRIRNWFRGNHDRHI